MNQGWDINLEALRERARREYEDVIELIMRRPVMPAGAHPAKAGVGKMPAFGDRLIPPPASLRAD